MASLPRTVLMFTNIFLFEIRPTVGWISRRIHARDTARLVLLCMVPGVCPSKSRASQPSTWNWCQVNLLHSPISLKYTPDVESTYGMNIVCSCPPFNSVFP